MNKHMTLIMHVIAISGCAPSGGHQTKLTGEGKVESYSIANKQSLKLRAARGLKTIHPS